MGNFKNLIYFFLFLSLHISWRTRQCGEDIQINSCHFQEGEEYPFRSMVWTDTIVKTAEIVELANAAPDEFKQMGKQCTVAVFGQRCKEVIRANPAVFAKRNKMQGDGKLLPVKKIHFFSCFSGFNFKTC